MEIKIFCLFKDTVKNAKGKPSNWEKCNTYNLKKDYPKYIRRPGIQ